MVEEFALSPSTRWYDFKKGGAGLKYEVALSIHTNEIIWIRGPCLQVFMTFQCSEDVPQSRRNRRKLTRMPSFFISLPERRA
jgi:hypothetical protein